ncbi:MAG: AAA family ATPase, partial [Gemmataceae bacterium]
GSGADCVFVLTTNRPEVLEPALAGRPGRVDQAVEFPLPDAACRRRLFAQFGRGLEVAAEDVEPLVGQTEGASPAFLKELFRRAALMALGRGSSGEPLPVSGEDFGAALRELVRTGGPLTRRFLGFPG